MAEVLFFKLDGKGWDGRSRLNAWRAQRNGVVTSFWKPSFVEPFPPGRRDPRILSYSLLHLLGQFGCAEYSMIALRDSGGRIAHSSMVMPSFARFPFMGRRDLQIGATETDRAFRGRGLAVRAIDEIVDRFGNDRTYWYLTEAANTASVSVIRKAGFTLVGAGGKKSRMGLRALGFYAITSPTQ
jgi:GNAT superfamily N-acetyltransferase